MFQFNSCIKCSKCSERMNENEVIYDIELDLSLFSEPQLQSQVSLKTGKLSREDEARSFNIKMMRSISSQNFSTLTLIISNFSYEKIQCQRDADLMRMSCCLQFPKVYQKSRKQIVI